MVRVLIGMSHENYAKLARFGYLPVMIVWQIPAVQLFVGGTTHVVFKPARSLGRISLISHLNLPRNKKSAKWISARLAAPHGPLTGCRSPSALAKPSVLSARAVAARGVTAQSIARLVPAPPANYVGGEILLNSRDTLKMSAMNCATSAAAWSATFSGSRRGVEPRFPYRRADQGVAQVASSGKSG